MRVIVHPHKIEIVKDEAVNEKEIDISKCYFEFDEEITDDYVKEAYFTLKDNTYKQIIQNNKCDFPSEVLEEKGDIELGVVAFLVENEEEIKRYNPSPAYFDTWKGSLKEAQNSEPITPTDKEQMEQALQNGLNDINNKIDEVDEKLDGIETAIEETNNLNLDVSDKVDGDVTVTLTKKDASTKTVVISDGTSLQFMWQGTSLGIKTEDMEEYTFVDLQGIPGKKGDTGEPFTIKKTYPSVAEMNADFNNMEYGDYVMIASSVEVEDNAKLYTRGESQWIFITDFSGAMGIRGETGLTPSIQIGTVVSGATPSVTRTGTDENPVLNFVLQKGDKGDKGNTGDTGNGISSIEKTSTSGLVDTYTITYTNGNTTTFDVSNGNGIDRIEKTATVGNKDTYTIYFTNGSTTTYEVSNGEVTREELEEEVDRLSMIYNAFPSTTGELQEEGSINGTAEVPFKEIGLKGNTSQSGEPTPDTPIPVNVVTGDNEVKVEGKNLLDGSSFENGTSNGITLTKNSINEVVLNGTSTAQANFNSDFFEINDIEKVVLSGGSSNITFAILTYTSDKTYIGASRDRGSGATYTIPSNASYYLVNIRVPNSGTTLTNYVLKAQIEKNVNTATTYEKHKEQTYPINLGSMELCKIGDYQDYLYKENGVWYKYGAIGKVVLDENSTKVIQDIITPNNKFIWRYTTTIDMVGSGARANVLSDYYVGDTTVYGENDKIGFYVNENSITNFACLLSTIGATTSSTSTQVLSLLNTWLSTHNVKFYYPLATPTITPITDTTLIEQLDNLEKAYSYDTQTNISQTNQDKPFIISYEAILSLRNVFNQGN